MKAPLNFRHIPATGGWLWAFLLLLTVFEAVAVMLMAGILWWLGLSWYWNVLLIGTGVVALRFVPSVVSFLRGRGKPLGWWRWYKMVVAEAWLMVWRFQWTQGLEPLFSYRRIRTPNQANEKSGLVSPDPQGPPIVLLIPGFFCNRAIFRTLQNRLDSHGISSIALRVPPTYDRLEQNRFELAREIHRHDLGRQNVILLGHSMGGILGRAFALESDEFFSADQTPVISAVITVASPHHGTDLMLPVEKIERGPPASTSRWLAELNRRHQERLARSAAIAFYAIYSENDNLVFPQASARLESAENFAFAGLGHLTLLESAQVFEVLLDIIQRTTRAVALPDATKGSTQRFS